MDPSDVCEGYALIAEYYDHVVPYRARKDVAFYVEEAKKAGGPVVELGCGTGRVLVPIARAGVEIVGVELSSAMLDLCRAKLAQEPEEVCARVELIQADMRHFALGRTFALATIPFRPFQHLTTVEDQLQCLECIRKHLAEDGRLIFEIFNPHLPRLVDAKQGEELEDEPEFELEDGRRVVRRHKIIARDLFNQVQDCELIYYVTHPDGREERLVHAFQMRYLFRFEAEHLLARCGFEVEQLWADFDRSPYGSRDPGELIFMARKV